MNRIYILFTLIYLPFLVQAQSSQTDLRIEQAQQTFAEFQTSVNNDDKEWPKKFIDSSSAAYYSNLLYLIKEADSTRLVEEKHSTILIVITARLFAKEGAYTSIKNPYDLIYFLNHTMTKNKLDSLVQIECGSYL